MFEALSDRLNTAVNKLSGRGRISEANVREAMVDVRLPRIRAWTKGESADPLPIDRDD